MAKVPKSVLRALLSPRKLWTLPHLKTGLPTVRVRAAMPPPPAAALPPPHHRTVRRTRRRRARPPAVARPSPSTVMASMARRGDPVEKVRGAHMEPADPPTAAPALPRHRRHRRRRRPRRPSVARPPPVPRPPSSSLRARSMSPWHRVETCHTATSPRRIVRIARTRPAAVVLPHRCQKRVLFM